MRAGWLLLLLLLGGCGDDFAEVGIEGPGPNTLRDLAHAYDPVTDRLVLFGGSEGYHYGGTWIYENRSYRYLPTDGPTPRSDASMAVDAEHRRLYLYGGRSFHLGNRIYHDDLWVFDLDTERWARVNVDPAPSPRYRAALTFDPASQLLLMTRGYGPPDGSVDETLYGYRWGEGWFIVL